MLSDAHWRMNDCWLFYGIERESVFLVQDAAGNLERLLPEL
jgi:hypothetical protein